MTSESYRRSAQSKLTIAASGACAGPRKPFRKP
jgi:hypothetical protein